MLPDLFLLKVSVVNNEACPTGTKEDDWDASANMVTCDYLQVSLHFNQVKFFHRFIDMLPQNGRWR